ncbi:unnamed protein product [Polarella glacialis]|uniref:Uncharacterized protein n=1 Tax=Polarella glacialis TaxID=89957 RepID=A0A813KB36_POLGL|nr:unnamed protein product [Polarella glacialis]CAE8632505.1 unnamed protein product [Polarella glacialis]CAE8692712.1 unnamed protein product [Polarella glacialis]CAE8695570.1 unnamed protein product [Polarella glacialis]
MGMVATTPAQLTLAAVACASFVLSAGQGDAVLGPRDNAQPYSSGGKCHLANLFLHSPADADGTAQPIDVSVVAGQLQAYKAVLDYSMLGFEVEATAVPQGSCQVSRMVTSTSMVDPGSWVMSDIDVKTIGGQDGGAPQSYTVNVSRLSGLETELRALQVRGAYLVPGWSPSIRNYTVELNLEQDLVRIDFQRLDNGQSVTLSAELEEPSAKAPTGGRRLAPDLQAPQIGEVQRLTSILMTTLDVGHQRVVLLSVLAADRAVAGTYELTVRRPPCPEEQRFFDGEAKRCTDICNEGYYGSSMTGRCTRCLDPHCAVCEPGSGCSLCFEGYELQDGGRSGPGQGRCVLQGSGSGLVSLKQVEEGVMGYEQKHQVLVMGAVSAGLVALCACAAFVYFTHSGGTSRRKPSLRYGENDQDELATFDPSDEDSYHAYRWE